MEHGLSNCTLFCVLRGNNTEFVKISNVLSPSCNRVSVTPVCSAGGAALHGTSPSQGVVSLSGRRSPQCHMVPLWEWPGQGRVGMRPGDGLCGTVSCPAWVGRRWTDSVGNWRLGFGDRSLVPRCHLFCGFNIYFKGTLKYFKG